MSWLANKETIVARFREPEILSAPIAGELDIPYFTEAELERHMLIVGNDLLRDVPEDDLSAIGSAAISLVSGSAAFRGMFRSIDLPLAAIGVLAAEIGGQPCVEAAAAGFFQLVKVSSPLDSAYTYGEGKILFYGTGSDTFTALVLSELDMATWKSDVPVLPPAYDLEFVDRVISRLQVIDYLKPMTMYGGVNNELV